VEANVRAICNLGSFSKSRRLGAFTGEKGEQQTCWSDKLFLCCTPLHNCAHVQSMIHSLRFCLCRCVQVPMKPHSAVCCPHDVCRHRL
jgi:hypothetical protein